MFGVGVIAYNLSVPPLFFKYPPRLLAFLNRGFGMLMRLGRLSASSPWKAQEYMALIQETMRADPEFRPGPFRGVSEQGQLQYCSRLKGNADAVRSSKGIREDVDAG